MFLREYSEIFKNSFFIEDLRWLVLYGQYPVENVKINVNKKRLELSSDLLLPHEFAHRAFVYFIRHVIIFSQRETALYCQLGLF